MVTSDDDTDEVGADEPVAVQISAAPYPHRYDYTIPHRDHYTTRQPLPQYQIGQVVSAPSNCCTLCPSCCAISGPNYEGCEITIQTTCYRQTLLVLVLVSFAQIGIGASCFAFAYPTPGAGEFFAGISSAIGGLIGLTCVCKGHCLRFPVSCLLVTSTFLLTVFSGILNFIAMCIDGPRFAEFTTYTECCNKVRDSFYAKLSPSSI